ncbi:MAG: hypothetical protein ACJ8F7_21235 [Gemmataceae bacterium]
MIRGFGRGAALMVCLGLVAFTGCAKGGAGYKITDAEGTIKLDGKPAAGVIVQFIPDKSLGQVPGSTGTTDDSGHYVMTTSNGRKGAVVGKHVVIIMNDRADERSGKKASGTPVPEKYTMPGALTVDVADGKKPYDFDLK